MSALDALRAFAQMVRVREFESRYPFGFLRERPASEMTNPGAAPMGPEITENYGARTDGYKRDFSRDDRWSDLLPSLEPARALYVVEPRVMATDRITVGRSRGCDVVLRYPSISKMHAVFVLRDGRVTALADANSANGTFVNDVRVLAAAPAGIALGDRLRFGTAAFDWVGAADVHAALTK